MATVDQFDRITVEPGKCGGKPCIRGMRITVRRVLELLATYPDQSAVIAEHPYLELEDFQQVLVLRDFLTCIVSWPFAFSRSTQSS